MFEIILIGILIFVAAILCFLGTLQDNSKWTVFAILFTIIGVVYSFIVLIITFIKWIWNGI